MTGDEEATDRDDRRFADLVTLVGEAIDLAGLGPAYSIYLVSPAHGEGDGQARPVVDLGKTGKTVNFGDVRQQHSSRSRAVVEVAGILLDEMRGDPSWDGKARRALAGARASESATLRMTARKAMMERTSRALGPTMTSKLAWTWKED